MRRAYLFLVSLFVIGVIGAIVACNVGGFDPQSKIDSVRILGVRADKPYAKPGETVTLDVLMVDGRREKPQAAKLYWIPVVCVNPRDDLYYLCFSQALAGDGGLADGGTQLIPAGPLADAGAPEAGANAGGGNPIARIPRGIDLGPFLPQGPTFSFRMPDNAVQPRQGTTPYGLAIVFNIACAGQVRLAEVDPARGPQQVPIQCTDPEGTPLEPKDYVISINRVYSYTDRTNTNPVIEKITLDGVDVDPQKGITLDKCVASRRSECKEWKIDIKVSDGSWEENPSEMVSGQALREQIWATYYSDLGDMDNVARLLFDTRRGRVSESDVVYRAPYDPAEGTIWAVVHDNRAGAAFVVLPLHVK